MSSIRRILEGTPTTTKSLTPKMMSSHHDTYATVCKVLEALPSSYHGYWWSAEDLARILSTGGVENVNEEIIRKALNRER